MSDQRKSSGRHQQSPQERTAESGGGELKSQYKGAGGAGGAGGATTSRDDDGNGVDSGGGPILHQRPSGGKNTSISNSNNSINSDKRSNNESIERRKSGKSELLYYIAAAILVFIIFFSKFQLVGGQSSSSASKFADTSIPLKKSQARLCGEFGYMNKTTGLCNCIQGFYGLGCTLRNCPFGTSWLSPPTSSNVRNQELVECSNMGTCETSTGICNCRSGFDGRACERTVCPGAGVVAAANGEASKGLPKGVVYSTNPQDAQECSGHGRCRSLREASNIFDGLNFRRPPVNYNNWDADKIHGCVCDYGWKGADCSEKQCALGKDPTRKKWDTDDILKIECQATSGFFIIQAFGGYTDAIPFDADPAYLKFALEQISGVGSVDTFMTLDSNKRPVMCLSASKATTTIRFLDHPGNSPPIRVIPQAAASRMWPTVTNLAHSTPANLALRVKTQFLITCEICPNCRGSIQFVYRNSVSSPIGVLDASAQTLITSAINGLSDLLAEGWTSFSFDVSGSASVCSISTKNQIAINIYSDYGNIPYLNIVDGSYGHYFWNITISSTKGNATLYECSNQGSCDSSTGTCNCLNSVVPYAGVTKFKVVGSDGRGGIGGRNDCGYISDYFPSCSYNNVPDAFCNGHGTCASSDLFCTCLDGYYGMTCQYRKCPRGPVMFDEPLSADTAHSMKECSGNGQCDSTMGTCTCDEGFAGAACQIKDCPRTFAPYGEACMGHGKCVSIREYYESFGYTYGDHTNYNNLFDYEYKYGRDKLYRMPETGPGFSSPNPSEYRLTYPSTWDALNWLECSCYGSFNDGKAPNSNVYAPRNYISGRISRGEPMPGWTGYDCGLRECPRGDALVVHGSRKTQLDNAYLNNVNEGHARGDQYGNGNFEQQKLVCTRSGADTAFYFVLTLNGKRSSRIYGTYKLWEVRKAIEDMVNVGKVKVSWKGAYSAVTVCAASHTDGILIQFLTELGNIGLLTSDQPGDVAITEFVIGSKANLECGGYQAGVCNRQSGRCECYPGYGSSDGAGGYGFRGDCSYVRGVANEAVSSTNMVIDFDRRRLNEAGNIEERSVAVDSDEEPRPFFDEMYSTASTVGDVRYRDTERSATSTDVMDDGALVEPVNLFEH